MWQAWINFILGIWVFFSGIVTSLTASANFIIVGIVVTILGFWTANKWQGVILGIAGLWLILSGIVPGLIAPANMIITGIVAAILAIWEGSKTQTATV